MHDRTPDSVPPTSLSDGQTVTSLHQEADSQPASQEAAAAADFRQFRERAENLLRRINAHTSELGIAHTHPPESGGTK